jgi:hypothetical protein
MQKNLLLGATNFSDVSRVPKDTVDQFILWVSASIDMQLSQAGYVIPLQDLAGEAWPIHQTAYLQLATCVGTISLISPALLPAPASGPGRSGSSGNVFRDLYQAELNRIWDKQTNNTQLRLRAKFYLGTPAEKAITEPTPPKADFSRQLSESGNSDRSRRMYFWDYTLLENRLMESFKQNSFNWLDLTGVDGTLQQLSYSPVTGYL